VIEDSPTFWNDPNLTDVFRQSNPNWLSLTEEGVEWFHNTGEDLEDAFNDINSFIIELDDISQDEDVTLIFDDDFDNIIDLAEMLYNDFSNPSSTTEINDENVNLSAWFDNPPASFLALWENVVNGADSSLSCLLPDRSSIIFDCYADESNIGDVCDGDGSSCSIELHAGSNLISFYALPDDLSLPNMMSNLGDNVTGVISEGAASTQIASGTWAGSLTHITASKGYWIVLDSDATLSTFDATPTDPSLIYYLHPGANLISFPSSGIVDVRSALPDSLEESFTGVISEGAATTQTSPGVWIGSLTLFEGSKGYWILAQDDIAFSYDLSTLVRNNIAYKEEKLSGYEYVQSSKQAFYFVESIEGINDGDYILAYNGDKIIGSKQWQGSIIDVPAMGSDGNNYSAGYMKAGNTPTFKLLSGGKLTTLEGDIPTWSDNGLFMVSNLSQVVIPETYSLSQAYPNPFNPITNLDFGIPTDCNISIDIYNIQGRLIESLLNGNIGAGYHTINWNADAYSSGMYFINIHANPINSNIMEQSIKTQKLLLIK